MYEKRAEEERKDLRQEKRAKLTANKKPLSVPGKKETDSAKSTISSTRKKEENTALSERKGRRKRGGGSDEIRSQPRERIRFPEGKRLRIFTGDENRVRPI